MGMPVWGVVPVILESGESGDKMILCEPNVRHGASQMADATRHAHRPGAFLPRNVSTPVIAPPHGGAARGRGSRAIQPSCLRTRGQDGARGELTARRKRREHVCGRTAQ